MRTLHVLSGGAAKGVVHAIARAFHEATGCDVDGTFGAVGEMKQRFLDGAPCDVVILTAALIDGLIGDGRVLHESHADLGRVATGVAVRIGEPTPDVSDAAAFADALIRATVVYVPDTQRSTAGIHIVDVLRRLGIHDVVAPRLRAFPNGATAMAHLADAAPGAIGCTQVTEIRYTAGVTLVGPLPTGYELSTVYTAGVSTSAADTDHARALVRWLSDSRSVDARRAGGFDFA